MALVEVLQHGGVGPLEQPLLAEGRRVACVHEDPPFARAAVDAAVADRVIQTFVLQKNERPIFPQFSAAFHPDMMGLTDNIRSGSL